MKGSPDQYVWTVGNSFNSDIILTKLAVGEGTSFAILHDSGKYYFRDFSALPFWKVPNVRVATSPKDQPTEAQIVQPLR